MGSPIIWAGNAAKLLKNALKFSNNVEILSGSLDPTSVAVDAPKGSQYLSASTGLTYTKNEAGLTTNWSLSSGAHTFASLTDLAASNITSFTTTATGDIGLYSDDGAGRNTTLDIGNYLSIYSANVGNDYGYLEVSPNYLNAEAANVTTGKSAIISLSSSGKARAEIQANLFLVQKVYASVGITDLDTGYAEHTFTVVPTGNVKVDKAFNSLFWVNNTTGSSITLEATTDETFNGNATVVVPAGKTYRFKVRSGAATYVVSDEATPSISGLASLASPTFTGTVTIPAGASITAPVITSAINTQIGITYTLVLADASKLVTLDNGSAIALTIPTNAVAAFAIGTSISIAQLGAGQVTVSGAGVTIRAAVGLKLSAQYAGASLTKIDTDTWLLVGSLSA